MVAGSVVEIGKFGMLHSMLSEHRGQRAQNLTEGCGTYPCTISSAHIALQYALDSIPDLELHEMGEYLLVNPDFRTRPKSKHVVVSSCILLIC